MHANKQRGSNQGSGRVRESVGCEQTWDSVVTGEGRRNRRMESIDVDLNRAHNVPFSSTVPLSATQQPTTPTPTLFDGL